MQKKYGCPKCFQIARSTDSHAYLICGYCRKVMVYVPPRGSVLESPELQPDSPPEPDLDGLDRGLDE